MIRKGMTIREAAEAWVTTFNAIQQGMIEKLMEAYPDLFDEVTTPSDGDRVYVCNGEYDGECGTIIADCYYEEHDLYRIEFDNKEFGDAILSEDEFFVERDSTLPMWGTMLQFHDGCDDWWLEEGDGIQIMSECGFRVYESDEFGYFFGIDGCGYDFYESHWIPLYLARGLRWHDPKAEKAYQMERKGYVVRKLGTKDYWFDGDKCIEEV